MCRLIIAASVRPLRGDVASERVVVRDSFFFSSRRRHTRLQGDWSSDVCSSDLVAAAALAVLESEQHLRHRDIAPLEQLLVGMREPDLSHRSGGLTLLQPQRAVLEPDRKSTRLNSSHLVISYAVFCLKKKKKQGITSPPISLQLSITAVYLL